MEGVSKEDFGGKKERQKEFKYILESNVHDDFLYNVKNEKL